MLSSKLILNVVTWFVVISVQFATCVLVCLHSAEEVHDSYTAVLKLVNACSK